MDSNAIPPTTFLDLPDELLDQILAEVKWGATAPTFDLDALQFYENLTQNTDTASIQRVRLTCRRLASRASALLLPVACISIGNPASVDRLEEIAGHGGLAPYVKAVHVYFDFYRADLAADIQLLATHLMRKGIQLLGVSSAEATAAQPLLIRGKTSAEWRRIRDDWGVSAFNKLDTGGEDGDCLASGPGADEQKEEPEGVRLLRREHAEYVRRYEAQQRLAGSVVERIARAMARMPRATRLVLDDDPNDDPDASAPRSDFAVPTDGEWLATPTTWATAFHMGHGSPPIETLFALPAAVHRAGVELTALRIHRLRLPDEFPLWIPQDRADEDVSPNLGYGDPPPLEAEELRAACASLRVFEFTPGYEPDCWPSDSLTHIEWPGMSMYWGPRRRLDEVLEWMLDSSRGRLQQVRVDLQMVHAGITHQVAMPPGPRWARLRVLHVQDGRLETATLASFLSASAGTLARLHLEGMRLCPTHVDTWPHAPIPYSWSSVLDLLRVHCREREHSGNSGGHNSTRPGRATATASRPTREPLTVRVRRPAGAEFEDAALSETDMAHIRALFEPGPDADGEGGSGISAVDRFIQGLSNRNPLVEAGKTKLLYP